MRNLLLVALSISAGCGGADSTPTAIDPTSVAQAALQAYDTNQDGKIGTKELEACAALRASLERLDANNDNALNAEEIANRITAYNSPPQLVRPEIFLKRGNQELIGGKVTLEPETFMGEDAQAYQGSSGSGGLVILRGVEDESKELNPGFYRVRITTPDGRETLEGCELAHDLPYIYRLTFVVR